jgi:hypothetical protein
MPAPTGTATQPTATEKLPTAPTTIEETGATATATATIKTVTNASTGRALEPRPAESSGESTGSGRIVAGDRKDATVGHENAGDHRDDSGGDRHGTGKRGNDHEEKGGEKE